MKVNEDPANEGKGLAESGMLNPDAPEYKLLEGPGKTFLWK